MPQMLIITDSHRHDGGEIVYRERLNLRDFESDHFSGQLAERVGWAVLDADRLEQKAGTHPSASGSPAESSAP